MDLDLEFSLAWQSNLLKAIDEGKTGKEVFTYCAKYHYDKNDMNNIVENYIGDLQGFANFLSKNWGWIIKFSEQFARSMFSKVVGKEVHTKRHTETGNRKRFPVFFAPILGILKNRQYYAMKRCSCTVKKQESKKLLDG